MSTVTALLDRPSSVATTVTISATAVSPASASDFTLSTNKVLTIAAEQTASTGRVTITAVDNDDDDDNRRVTVPCPSVADRPAVRRQAPNPCYSAASAVGAVASQTFWNSSRRCR